MTEIKKQTFLVTPETQLQRSEWYRHHSDVEIIGQVTRPYKRKQKGKLPAKTNLEELIIYYKEEPNVRSH